VIGRSPENVKEEPSDPLVIRGAGPEDASAIAGIYNEAVRTTVATFDTEPRSVPHQVAWIEEHLPRYPVLVAQRSSGILGWASLSPWSDRKAYDGTAEVSVYVLGTERRRGIGKRLLADLVERGRAMGLHTLLARIADGNEVSLHLHESIGFLRIGIMREVGWKFGRWVDVNLLQYLYPDPAVEAARDPVKGTDRTAPGP
jgi:L-amino acid N-acyltransferase YncA